MYVAACLIVFFAMYGLTIVTTSIGYHRALAHNAIRINPTFKWLLLTFGNWITGVDPKAWVVMHRLHHRHSDGPEDPHSPRNVGIAGILGEQLKSYNKTLRALERDDEVHVQIGQDLDFPLSWPIRSGFFYLPYFLHFGIGLAIGIFGHMWFLGLAYFAGILSHGVQGFLVNSLGHAVGGRNFDIDDNSRNNTFAAWMILGEGYQNNHHQFPSSARFSYRKSEVDFGYAVCCVLDALGVVTIKRESLSSRTTSIAAALPISTETA